MELLLFQNKELNSFEVVLKLVEKMPKLESESYRMQSTIPISSKQVRAKIPKSVIHNLPRLEETYPIESGQTVSELVWSRIAAAAKIPPKPKFSRCVFSKKFLQCLK